MANDNMGAQQYGTMAEWQKGSISSMVDWQNGNMGVQQHGEMAEWQNGSTAVW